MKKQVYLLASVLLLGAEAVIAQTTFNTAEIIDINNIRTTTLLHGDLWFDPTTGTEPFCEFPKNSGKHIMNRGAIWMAGYDKGNTLHVSAQTYRQSGNDYWPGPLNALGNSTMATITDWAKIWKINKTDITTFLAIPTRNTGNIPKPVMEWPAKGNPYAKGNAGAQLTINAPMAPFIDVNKDGTYNPIDGDYPDMQGDQMLWWIFNDNGPIHNHSTNGGLSMQMEVHCKAFAYARNTQIDNAVFYEFDIMNKSLNDYTGFRTGVFADVDLGASNDDYIGFDSSRRMGIVYNGNSIDGHGQTNAYGNSIPVAGVSFLRMPGDTGNDIQPAGSFTYYNNDNSIAGNPATDADFNNYLRAKLRSGDPFRNDFVAPRIKTKGFGTGPIVNYVFPGDPTDISQWSECSSENPIGDRRFIISTNDFTFAAGTTQRVAFALVVTDTSTDDGCRGAGFKDIKIVADSAWAVYKQLKAVSVADKQPATKQLNLYPNPANDVLYIETNTVSGTSESIRIYDNTGRSVNIEVQPKAGRTGLNISSLPAGVYHIQYIDSETQYRGRFIKQ